MKYKFTLPSSRVLSLPIDFFSCLGDSHPRGPGDLHACTPSLTLSLPMGDLLTESLDHLSAGTLHRMPGYTTEHHAGQSLAAVFATAAAVLTPSCCSSTTACSSGSSSFRAATPRSYSSPQSHLPRISPFGVSLPHSLLSSRCGSSSASFSFFPVRPCTLGAIQSPPGSTSAFLHPHLSDDGCFRAATA